MALSNGVKKVANDQNEKYNIFMKTDIEVPMSRIDTTEAAENLVD